MANTNLTHGDVKNICENLECSPSSNSPGSSIYNPGEGEGPHAKKHAPKHSSGAKGHMTNTEKHFGTSRRTAAKNVPKHV
jgi:hypothetical protein